MPPTAAVVVVGLVVVVAAGNSGKTGIRPETLNSIHFPGTAPSAMASSASAVDSRSAASASAASSRGASSTSLGGSASFAGSAFATSAFATSSFAGSAFAELLGRHGFDVEFACLKDGLFEEKRISLVGRPSSSASATYWSFSVSYV